MNPVTIDDSIDCTMCVVADANSLHESFLLARKNTDWKESVQRYEVNELKHILHAQKKIRNGYKPTETKKFILHERGHKRLIKPNTVDDRVVYKSFNRNVMLPHITKRIIHDNGASIKGKGLSFSRRRFEIHLRKALSEYGEDAWILFIDFKKYFDNIDHDTYKEQCDFLSGKQMEMLCNFLDGNKIDVSYMSDSEYGLAVNNPFNALAYESERHECYGNKYLHRSVGIGSENAQTAGIFLPYKLDNYIKIVCSVKYYGRYMDDSYIIMKDKDSLKSILTCIESECKKLNIFLNKEKIRYSRINGKFTFLKVNYIYSNGKYIRKIPNSNILRERKRLRKFYVQLINGKMSLDDILQCYLSWRGGYRKFDNGYKIKRIDELFSCLFNISMEELHERTRKNGTKGERPKGNADI